MYGKIPNTFLVWRRSEIRKNIEHDHYLYATLLRYGPATAATANAGAGAAQSTRAGLLFACSSVLFGTCRAVR